jgi:hypothetical protein
MPALLDRRETLAALGASLALGGPGRAQTAPVDLPLTEARARFFLPVTANGGDELSFVLDTGSPSHIISQSVADRLGLRVIARSRLRAFDGGGESPVVRADRFAVGGVELGPTSLVVWPDARIEGHAGLIGYPLLAEGAVLALAERKLSIRMPWGAPGTAVKADVRRTGATLLGGLAGAEGRFAFDTGAQELTISQAYHQRILTNPAYLEAPKLQVRGPADNPAVGRILAFRPKALQFGDLVCTDPLVRIAQPDGREGVLAGVDGLVGVALLRRYVWGVEPGRLIVLAEAPTLRAPGGRPLGAPLAIPPQGGVSPVDGVTFGAPVFEPAPR